MGSVNATDVIPDPDFNVWNVSNAIKKGIWSYHVIVNFLGFVVCALVVFINVINRKNQVTIKIAISSLAASCGLMSILFLIQCLINLIANTEWYGHDSCFWLAYFSISAIIIQFFSTAFIAFVSYQSVTKHKFISARFARNIIILIWLIAPISTWIFGFYSKVTSNAYCFYDFGSVVITYWFVPIILSTLFYIVYCYMRIFIVSRNSPITAFKDQMADHKLVVVKVIRRSVSYIVIFFFSWIFVAVYWFYTIVNHRENQTLDILVRVFASMHSVAVPIVYGHNIDDIKIWFSGYCCCKKYKKSNMPVTIVIDKVHSPPIHIKTIHTIPIVSARSISYATDPNICTSGRILSPKPKRVLHIPSLSIDRQQSPITSS